jgi:glycosyltransferase involved in cell wall biosynthesis/2-polyprenyl-3-methyl-5-hydroxy-6-metoxy-1,4-benzoquinol methylase
VPTVESVLQQDYPHIECIVVDAGSSDGTIEILKSYGDRIRWVSEPDNGQGDAINKGWKMSRGEILAWLNADDVWEVPGAVSRAVEYLRANPEAEVVYGDCGEIDSDGNVVGMSYLREWDLEYAVEYCDHCIPQPAAFIRRRILEKVGWLDPEIFKVDHELWLRIALAGEIHHLPTLLGHARNLKGMSFDGLTAAPSCVQLTRKFFTLPNVPEALRKKKRRAVSNAFLRGIDYAWEGGRHWSLIAAYTLRAILADFSNTRGAVRRLKGYLEMSAQEKARFRWLLLAYILLNAPRRAWIETRAMISGLFQPPANEEAKEVRPAKQNLLGDRDIEWSWIASQMPCAKGEALDFGNGGSHLGLIAAQRGFNVTAVDMGPVSWPYVHPRLHFIQGDILKLQLPPEEFDLILNCSTIEHVGLVGRYDVTESRLDGDFEAMARLRALMKPDGIMLLTIPIGCDAVFAPLCRVYGRERLPRLLEGYVVEKELFWVKDQENRWVQGAKDAALNFEAFAGSWDPMQNVTALGCFVLRKGREDESEHGIV